MLCMGNGKEIKKRRDIWIPIADSLCHRAEPDTAVQSNQSKKKKKKRNKFRGESGFSHLSPHDSPSRLEKPQK